MELESLGNEGGWVFWFLILLAFGIGFSLLSIRYYLNFPNAPKLATDQWRKLLDNPGKSPELLESLREGLNKTQREGHLMEIEQHIFSIIERRIPFAFVLIGTAPLIGLLGTVSGMFTTFDGMAGNSFMAPVDVVSRGISEALITTQTGLVISIPSFILCSILKGRYLQMRNGFLELEAALIETKTLHG